MLTPKKGCIYRREDKKYNEGNQHSFGVYAAHNDCTTDSDF